MISEIDSSENVRTINAQLEEMKQILQRASPDLIFRVSSTMKVYNLIKGKFPTITGEPLGKSEDIDLDESGRGLGPALRAVQDFTKLELVDLEKRINGVGEGIVDGYSIEQVRSELLRRRCGAFDGLHVLRAIINLCLLSRDRLTSHLDLFWQLCPGEQFDGLGAKSKVMLALKAAVLSCVEYDLVDLH